MIATSMPQGTFSAWDIKRWLQESSLFPRKRQPKAEGGEDVKCHAYLKGKLCLDMRQEWFWILRLLTILICRAGAFSYVVIRQW